MRDDLHLGVRGNDGECRIVEVVIGFPLLLFAALPPHLDDADLGQERVLDEGIEHDEAGILLHEHVIDVIRLLLGGGDVLRACRLEPHHLVARGEDVHQCRHQSFHRVGDVGRHRLRAAVRRRHVARHVAEVVVERGRALLRQLGRRHRGQGIGLLRGEQRAQIGIGHFRHGGSGLELYGTQQRASRRRKATPWRNDHAAAGRYSTLRRRSGCPRALLDDTVFLQDSGYKVNHFLGSYGKFVSDRVGAAQEHAHACELCLALLKKSIRHPRLFAFDASICRREARRGEGCAAQGSHPRASDASPDRS